MRRYRILMVDDRVEQFAQMRDAVASLPEVERFDHARHAAEALDRTGPNRDAFDLILLDQEWDEDEVSPEYWTDLDGNLPARTAPERYRQGLGILRYLRNHGVTVPVVYATAVPTLEVLDEAIEAGAVSYYAKRDLKQRPVTLVELLEGRDTDLAFVRRELRRLDLSADSQFPRWLVGRRDCWRRRWMPLTRGLLEHAAAVGMDYLDAAALHRFRREVLPRLEREFREEMTATDLAEWLANIGENAPWRIFHLPPVWWAVHEEDARRAFVILAPEAVEGAAFAPPDWLQTTRELHTTAVPVLPTTLLHRALGPTDPFWDTLHLLLLQPLSEHRWALRSEDAADPCRMPLAAIAGRVGLPGEKFWQAALASASVLETSEPVAACKFASLASLYAVELGGSPPAPMGLSLVPLPGNLVRTAALDHWQRSPRRQLLSLHDGAVPGEQRSEGRLNAELKSLPRVEVWRASWPHPFEEETLQRVLAVLGASSGGPFAVWLGAEFLHGRLGRSGRLQFHARETDVLVAAPQGLCVLECKSSLNPRDLHKGYHQIKDQCEHLWCGEMHKRRHAGVFAAPLLRERLAVKNVSWKKVLEELLVFVPPALAKRLRATANPTAAATVVEEYYRGLEQALHKYRHAINACPPLDELRPDNRTGVPPLVGLVVLPEEFRGAAEHFVVRCSSELPDRLRAWLTLPPVWGTSELRTVVESLRHLCQGSGQGLQDFEGFQPKQRRDLGAWRIFEGTEAVTGASQTLLVRPEKSLSEDARRFYAQWLALPLADLACDLRWLDARGLPATDPRHLQRLAVVLRGTTLVDAQLRVLPPAEQLGAVAALLRLGVHSGVSELLGAARSDPVAVAQRLMPGEPLRFGWLPGETPRETAARPAENGRRRVLAALLRLLSPVDERSPLAAAQQVLREMSSGRGPTSVDTVLKRLAAVQRFAAAFSPSE